MMARHIEIPDDLGNRLLTQVELQRARQQGSDALFQGQLRPAAVLMPLFVTEDGWNLLYTQRTQKVDTHRGQVSFPGGAVDPGDESLSAAACREAWEEVGIRPADIKVIGQLSELNLVSYFRVTPVVGMIPWPYDLVLSVAEVETAFWVPLDWLADPENSYDELWMHAGQKQPVTFFKPYQGQVIWGATARMTVQLLEALK